MNDQKGAGLMLPATPAAKVLIGDRGYDSNPFREGLAARAITACIPSKKNRKQPIPHDPKLYRKRYPVEVMFGRFKDWRRIATRHDRCPRTFFGAITLAAIFIFWLER